LELLRWPDARVRLVAAGGLAAVGERVGRDAREVSADLVGALEDEDPTVRMLARLGLENIDPEALAAHGRGHPGAGPERGE
jgi:hypothetical protein